MLLVFTWPPHVLPSAQPTLQPRGTFLQAPRFLLPPRGSSSFPLLPPSAHAKPPLTLPSFSYAFSPSIHHLPQNGPSPLSCIVLGKCLSHLCKRKRRSRAAHGAVALEGSEMLQLRSRCASRLQCRLLSGVYIPYSSASHYVPPASNQTAQALAARKSS